jgi:iron-sulfur cluster repair protein YtfE (RIC family)
MNKIMEFMSEDHDRLDEIFNSFQKLKVQDLEQGKKLFAEFNSGLQRHIVWEEEILFPAFEEQTGMKGAGPTAVMRIEHHQIKGFMEKIHQLLQKQDNRTGDAEEGLIRVLTSHNQKEETVLYPWIDRSISEEERKEMIAKMAPGLN